MRELALHLDTAGSARDLQSISAEMESLEQLLRNLDVDPSAMEDFMSLASTLTAHQERVARFLRELTEETGLEGGRDQLPEAPSTGVGQDEL
ncbi:charged multivesicular body protein 1a-like [Sorex araneus]|uniref:charged multivesicular body protein 1a-like n=1 Tax=Sorex araneus TaxID=42254 RepID=UPI00243374A6|nr:charged multivesicular body protein 1a-like [Sorex araneus]